MRKSTLRARYAGLRYLPGMRRLAWLGVAALALALAPTAARAGEEGGSDAPADSDRPYVPDPDPPWLGVAYTPYNGTVGLLVTNVFEDSAAIASGLRIGDEIIEVDGVQTPPTIGDLSGIIGSHSVGDKLMVRVYRDNHVLTLHPVLARKVSEAELLHLQLVGRALPAFTLVKPDDPDGEWIDDSVLAGKVGIVAWFHTSCTGCATQANKLAPWIASHRGSVGVVGMGGPEMLTPDQLLIAAKSVIDSTPLDLPVGVDEDAWLHYAFGDSGRDSLIVVVVDRTGVVQMATAVPADADDSALDDVFAAAERALKQRKPRR